MNIDFRLLHEQKLSLAERLSATPDDALWGLVTYLDAVLDNAEESGEFVHPDTLQMAETADEANRALRT